jgi:PAS domain S-box-containing protein
MSATPKPDRDSPKSKRGPKKKPAPGAGSKSVPPTRTQAVERSGAEHEAAQREALLRAIFENEPECVKLLTREGNLVEMNRAGLEMIQADSFEQVRGQCVYSVVAEEDRARFQELTKRVFQGESGTLEFEVIGLKGARRRLETPAVPLRDESGVITMLLGITRDVTQQERREHALRESENKFRAVAETTSGGIFIRKGSRFRYVNSAASCWWRTRTESGRW